MSKDSKLIDGSALKGLILDGIAASQAIDSSGESIEIKGIDISDFENGTGLANYEHRKEVDEGASANDIVGRVIMGKKIFGESDCANARERKYWNSVELPFVYIQVELFDGEGHAGAQAIAAMCRHYAARGLPIIVRFSIEGSTLGKDGGKITRSVARKVALTVRPCNRSCITGILKDPQEDGKPSVPEVSSVKATLDKLFDKFEAPDAQRLGSHEMESSPILEEGPEALLKNSLERLREVVALSKTLSAGGGNAAPSTLTGGAALAREDEGLHRFIKAQVLAAVRDWRGQGGDFKTFLKSRLVDVDPSYVDHFSNIIEDFRIRKAQQLQDDLVKATRPTQMSDRVGVEPQALAQDDDEPDAKDPVRQLTIRGKKIRALPSLTRVGQSRFDEKTGTLYTPKGAFKAYNPELDDSVHQGMTGKQAFHAALTDPATLRYHARAMGAWRQLNGLLKTGQVPATLASSAAHFSVFSANNPVHVQEMMYSHLQDLLKDYGLEPDAADLHFLSSDFQGRSGQMPHHARPYWEGPANSAIVNVDGSLNAHGRGDQLFPLAAKFGQEYKTIADTMQQYRADGRSAVRDLLQIKRKDRTRIPGLANKTVRYAYAMLGGSNIVVPDTHFVRHFFGLDPVSDSDTAEYLKVNVLWNVRNGHLLDAMDRWYHQNHPAVKFTQQKYFGGENTEDSIFPAFWLHWMAIRPHEKALGLNMPKGGAHNEGVDHTPYWKTVHEVLTKHGIPFDFDFAKSEDPQEYGVHQVARSPINVRASLAFHELQDRLGAGAFMPYFGSILPALLNHAAVRKMEQLTESLTKGESKSTEPKASAPIPKFRGKHVRPGQIEVLDGNGQGIWSLPYLGQDEGHEYVVDGQETKKMPRAYEGVGYRITRPPEEITGTRVINHEIHGTDSANQSDDQRALIHGLDLDKLQGSWGSSAAGHHGHVKPAIDHNALGMWEQEIAPNLRGFSSARREAVFHNLARDVFGLGPHVPVAAVFNHPETGAHHSVTRFIPGAIHPEFSNQGGRRTLNPNDDTAGQLEQLGRSGQLDKMAIMDHVLGHGDRSDANWVVTPGRDPGVHLIGNGLAFNHDTDAIPSYLYRYHQLWDPTVHVDELHHEPFHPGTDAWIKSLDPQELGAQMIQQGVPDELVRASVKRLMAVQQKFQGPGVTKGSVFMTGER